MGFSAEPRAAQASADTSAGGPASAQDVLAALRFGSLAILGGYTVAICYRVGLFRKLLPVHVNAKLEQTVEKIKARTEPIGNIKRFAMARRHLIQTYGWTASGMVTAAAGVALFCAQPKIPIALPLAVTVFSSILLGGLPKTLMIPPARVLCFYASCLSAGYCFGPIGWAAQDTLLLFVMLSGCTITGLCVPLFLTRGMVSYVTSAQLLSLALSLSLITAPKATPAISPFGRLKAQPGVQVILNGDANVLLTMQIITNVGINVLHTLPTIYYYVSSTDSDEAIGASVDPLREAFCICAGWGYVNYRLVRLLTRALIRRVLAEDSRGAHSGSEGSWTLSGSRRNGLPGNSTGVSIASSVTAGLVSLLFYVRAVSLLQKGDAEATLKRLRVVCAHMSPIGLLLGSQSEYMR